MEDDVADLTPRTLDERKLRFGYETPGTGWRPDPLDYRDHQFSVAHAKAGLAAANEGGLERPMNVDKVDPHPVYDQGQTNSCVGNAVAVMHSVVRGVVPRSRLQIYYEARRLIGETHLDEGAYIRDAIKVISSLGAGRETWWAFKPEQITADPPEKVDRDALLRRVFSYSRLAGADDYKLCLADEHPFVIGIACFDSLFGPTAQFAGILNFPQAGERMWGGHAILIKGYEPDFRATLWGQSALAQGLTVPARAYIARNSWGAGWGRGGDFAIDALFLEHPYMADDAWTIRKVRPPAGA